MQLNIVFNVVYDHKNKNKDKNVPRIHFKFFFPDNCVENPSFDAPSVFLFTFHLAILFSSYLRYFYHICELRWCQISWHRSGPGWHVTLVFTFVHLNYSFSADIINFIISLNAYRSGRACYLSTFIYDLHILTRFAPINLYRVWQLCMALKFNIERSLKEKTCLPNELKWLKC